MSKPARSLRRDGEFLHAVDVRWGDMDALGHVNNAKYFTYSESARIAFLDELFAGDPQFMDRHGPILAAISCDYHEQVHYPARLELGVRIAGMGRSSVQLQCPVFQQGKTEAVADIQATIVWFDYAEQKTVPVPQLLRNCYKQA